MTIFCSITSQTFFFKSSMIAKELISTGCKCIELGMINHHHQVGVITGL